MEILEPPYHEQGASTQAPQLIFELGFRSLFVFHGRVCDIFQATMTYLSGPLLGEACK